MSPFCFGRHTKGVCPWSGGCLRWAPMSTFAILPSGPPPTMLLTLTMRMYWWHWWRPARTSMLGRRRWIPRCIERLFAACPAHATCCRFPRRTCPLPLKAATPQNTRLGGMGELGPQTLSGQRYVRLLGASATAVTCAAWQAVATAHVAAARNQAVKGLSLQHPLQVSARSARWSPLRAAWVQAVVAGGAPGPNRTAGGRPKRARRGPQ
jgi:hypothetical protein